MTAATGGFLISQGPWSYPVAKGKRETVTPSSLKLDNGLCLGIPESEQCELKPSTAQDHIGTSAWRSKQRERKGDTMFLRAKEPRLCQLHSAPKEESAVVVTTSPSGPKKHSWERGV